MSINNKFWNSEDTSYLYEDILNRYYLIGKKNEVSKIVKDFIYKLCENCAGIFSEDDIWNIIQILEEQKCINDDILVNSSVQKFTKTSNHAINAQVKEEICDLAVNKVIKHIDEKTLDEKEYRTECFTIDKLKESIKFGELVSTLKYSNNGFDLNQKIYVNIESRLSFSKDNVLIKVKENIADNSIKKYVRVIIVKKIEK